MRHPFAVLLVLANDQGITRFGFSASRHVGQAVVRNRTRRLFSEATRHFLQQIQPGWDCFFLIRRSAVSASYPDIQKAVQDLLTQANLWHSSPS